jgi:hypothetical protein
MYQRVSVSAPHEWFRMPPLGTTVAHAQFVQTLTNWILTLPERDWLTANIGNPVLEGSAEQHSGTIRVWSSGKGSNDDDIFLLAKPVSGTTTFSALLHNATGPQTREAGIMLRSSTQAGSPYAALFAQGSDIVFSVRKSAGASTDNVARFRLRAIGWLKLQRDGATVSAHYLSTTGEWETLASAQLEMPDEIYAGLYVSSGAVPAEFAKAEFADYQLNSMNIRFAPDFPGTLQLNAISESFPSAQKIQLESSSNMNTWLVEDSATIVERSSTRREVWLEKQINPAQNEFFRIRRVD